MDKVDNGFNLIWVNIRFFGGDTVSNFNKYRVHVYSDLISVAIFNIFHKKVAKHIRSRMWYRGKR